MTAGTMQAQTLGRERKWLTRKEAATFLENIGCPVSVSMLEKMASNDNAGEGPSFWRIRWRRVLYQPADLRAWAQKNVRRVE